MATTATPRKVIVALMLNNGTSPSGIIKTKTLRIGGPSQDINVEEYTDTSVLAENRAQALALAGSLGLILSKTVFYVSEQIESTLRNS